MIGQQKLIYQIDMLISNNKFPRFSIVVGERGMEHEDVAHYIANRMGTDCITLPDVKVDTIRDMISTAYKLHSSTVYCIKDADDMSVNAKNAMLKVVEDAPNKAYFVMCLEDLSNTLATIKSRGIVFRMDRPAQSDIREFAESLYVNKSDIDKADIDIIGNICHSAGDVLMLMHYGPKNFYAYAEYVVANMIALSGAEVFKLSDKLALKDEEDKYDCSLFLRALQRVLLEKISIYKDYDEFRSKCLISNAIGRYASDLRIKGINKTMLMDNLYLEVRKIWKSVN